MAQSTPELDELGDYIAQVLQYTENAYPSNKEYVYKETERYVQEVLRAFAENVHAAADNIVQDLGEQSHELGQLDTRVNRVACLNTNRHQSRSLVAKSKFFAKKSVLPSQPASQPDQSDKPHKTPQQLQPFNHKINYAKVDIAESTRLAQPFPFKQTQNVLSKTFVS